jgi:hypothetical protein
LARLPQHPRQLVPGGRGRLLRECGEAFALGQSGGISELLAHARDECHKLLVHGSPLYIGGPSA